MTSEAPEFPQTMARPLERDPKLLEYLGIVQKIARSVAQTVPHHITYGDLMSAGNLAVAAVLRSGKLDQSSPEEAKHYIAKRVRGEIIDELSRLDYLSRNLIRARRRIKLIKEANPDISDAELAEKMGLTPEDYRALSGRIPSRQPVESMDSLASSRDLLPPDEQVDRLRKIARLHELVERELSPRDSVVMQSILQQRPYKEIAAELGVSEPYISQIFLHSTQKLKKAAQRAKDGNR